MNLRFSHFYHKLVSLNFHRERSSSSSSALRIFHFLPPSPSEEIFISLWFFHLRYFPFSSLVFLLLQRTSTKQRVWGKTHSYYSTFFYVLFACRAKNTYFSFMNSRRDSNNFSSCRRKYAVYTNITHPTHFHELSLSSSEYRERESHNRLLSRSAHSFIEYKIGILSVNLSSLSFFQLKSVAISFDSHSPESRPRSHLCWLWSNSHMHPKKTLNFLGWINFLCIYYILCVLFQPTCMRVNFF